MLQWPSMQRGPVLWLKTEGPGPGSQAPKDAAAQEDEVALQDDELWYVCRNCHRRLTQPNARMNILGSHRHTFANPSGVVFEVVCFSFAQGFNFLGPPSMEFTWFAGHSWRIIVCSTCMTHIGWVFQAPSGGAFFGLIADRLRLLSLPRT
jgi:hypothetical protein